MPCIMVMAQLCYCKCLFFVFFYSFYFLQGPYSNKKTTRGNMLSAIESIMLPTHPIPSHQAPSHVLACCESIHRLDHGSYSYLAYISWLAACLPLPARVRTVNFNKD